MLQTCLARLLASTKQQEAKHLLKELLYLPLAVAQAAACINTSSITLQEYWLQLDEYEERALKYSNNSSKGKLQNSSIKDPVAAILFLLINYVCYNNALAADYLFLTACVDRKDISLNLLEAASPQAREDAIRVLNKYALVTRRPAKSALDVHQLIYQALRKWLQLQGQLRHWT
jgi:hypothetical protein